MSTPPLHSRGKCCVLVSTVNARRSPVARSIQTKGTLNPATFALRPNLATSSNRHVTKSIAGNKSCRNGTQHKSEIHDTLRYRWPIFLTHDQRWRCSKRHWLRRYSHRLLSLHCVERALMFELCSQTGVLCGKSHGRVLRTIISGNSVGH